MMLNDLSLL